MKKLSRLLRSSKGVSSLVAALVLLVTAAMGTYLFETVTDLSRPTQERITHLSNAMTMARAIDEHLRGAYLGEARFGVIAGGNVTAPTGAKDIKQILDQRGVKIALADTENQTEYFINTLGHLIEDVTLNAGNDPTSERMSQIGADTKVSRNKDYDKTKSIVKYRFLGGEVGSAPAVITHANIASAAGAKIYPTSIEVLVDLVSSTFNTGVDGFKIGNDAPIDGDNAFAYLCMSSDTKCGTFKGSGKDLDDDSWIDQSVYVNGIESDVEGQPSLAPSKTIKMPDDFKIL